MPWNKQNKGAAAQIKKPVRRSALDRATRKLQRAVKAVKKVEALKEQRALYDRSVMRVSAFHEWSLEAERFKKKNAYQKQSLVSNSTAVKKLDVAAIKKYLKGRKKQISRRRNRLYSSFYSKRTDSFYLLRNKDLAQRSKKKRFPLTYYKQESLNRVPETVRSFEPSLQSFWYFLENYKNTVCKKQTSKWKKEQYQKLLLWVEEYSLHPYIPRLFVKENFDAALMRIKTGFHPDEKRVRVLQRSYEKWCNRRPRSLTKSRNWLLSETKALGLYFEYKNYTTYADPKKTKQIRCSVKNILKQARCLRSILAPKVKRFPAKLSVAVAKKKNKNLKSSHHWAQRKKQTPLKELGMQN